ncbi:MAG: hypothetical protein AAGK78_17230, partial [Planctomycetota bacterium]
MLKWLSTEATLTKVGLGTMNQILAALEACHLNPGGVTPPLRPDQVLVKLLSSLQEELRFDGAERGTALGFLWGDTTAFLDGVTKAKVVFGINESGKFSLTSDARPTAEMTLFFAKPDDDGTFMPPSTVAPLDNDAEDDDAEDDDVEDVGKFGLLAVVVLDERCDKSPYMTFVKNTSSTQKKSAARWLLKNGTDVVTEASTEKFEAAVDSCGWELAVYGRRCDVDAAMKKYDDDAGLFYSGNLAYTRCVSTARKLGEMYEEGRNLRAKYLGRRFQ